MPRGTLVVKVRGHTASDWNGVLAEQKWNTTDVSRYAVLRNHTPPFLNFESPHIKALVGQWARGTLLIR